MSFVDQLLALLRWKRLILVNTLIVAVGSVVVALILPKWYRSTASIFPPEEESFGLGSLSSLVSLSALGAGKSYLPVWASPSDVYASILRSRTVREELIRRFDLVGYFKVADLDHALPILNQRVKIHVGGEGIVLVSVEDPDPVLASKMANTLVELLDKVNREKRSSSAGAAREFIEKRLDENRADLAAAEDSLRALQERTGILIPDDQVRAIVDAGVDLESKLLIKEVELEMLEAQVGPEHPDREALAREVRTLRAKLAELDTGDTGASLVSGTTGGDAASRFEIPLDRYPSLALAYLRAMREVTVQEKIYEFLSEQYEQFRIQETRDTPTIHVLDEARPTTIKVRPIRWLICVTATLLAFFVSVLLAVALESLRRLKHNSPDRFERLRRLAAEFRLGPLLDRL